MEVIVVGGGPAGLAAGWQLMRRGVRVRVLEATPHAGGKVQSRRRDGWLCEAGPEGWLDSEADAAATRDAVGALGLGPTQLRASASAGRRRFIFRGGRLHTLPTGLGAFLGSGLLSAGGKARLLLEPFQHAGPDDESVAAFARRHLGDEALAALVHPFVSGIYAGDPEEMSLAASFPKLSRLVRTHGGVVRGGLAMAFGGRRRLEAGGAPGRPAASRGRRTRAPLTSFTGGMHTLPAALARALGDALVVGVEVTRVEPLAAGAGAGAGASTVDASPRWRVHAGGATHDADVVIVTVPSPIAARLLERDAPELAAPLSAILWSTCAVVAVGARADALAPDALDGFGWLAARGEPLRSLGVLWSSSIFEGRAPAGHVLLRGIFGGARDAAAVALPDAELLATAVDDLHRALGVRLTPTFSHVERWPLAIPRYTLGHLDRLATLEAGLAARPGLHLAGHSYRGVGVNDVLRDVAALVERLAPTRDAARTAAAG